jgi:UDP-2,4-diacetamido-2,4,6-trideoxy-beta-L-altropyranose hydrolase
MSASKDETSWISSKGQFVTRDSIGWPDTRHAAALKVLFRADASIALGAGHVMRCLALADALKSRGADCTFMCAGVKGNLLDVIEARGHAVQALRVLTGPTPVVDWTKDADLSRICAREIDPDWLVVDHYSLGVDWEQSMRPCVGKTLAIDDIGRTHCCDVLLDQNLETSLHDRYKTTTDTGRILMLGPAFALLQQDFAALRSRSLARRSGTLGRILVSMGGSDPENETSKALAGLAIVNRSDWIVDVVIGAQNPHAAAVADACRQLPGARMHVQTSKMAELMMLADCAVNAGGSTTWERCCLGLPAVATIVSDDQSAIIDACARLGAHVALGRSNRLHPADYARAIASLTADGLRAMSHAAAGICDGLGATRVAARML